MSKTALSSNTGAASRLFTAAQIRAIECSHQDRFPKHSLMQRAGLAAAKFVVALLKDKAKGKEKPQRKPHILVLVGPGNNGGDALVAAVQLKKLGFALTVVSPVLLTPSVQGRMDAAGITALSALKRAKTPIHSSIPSNFSGELVIDGLFGIGLTRPPSGVFAEIINKINVLRALVNIPVLALDVPSGLNTDSGVAYTPTITADHTITFLGLKPGLFTADGKDVTAEIHIETLGVAQPDSDGHLLTRELAATHIRPRKHASHKGTYGTVGIIGGADGMIGAAILAARAALMMGPGKVFVGFPQATFPSYDPINPELMLRQAEDVLSKLDSRPDAIAIGMGLGTGSAALRILRATLKIDCPKVLDADALNLLAQSPALQKSIASSAQKSSTGAASGTQLAQKAHQCLSLVITPHPGEAARLLGCTTSEVEKGRVGAALRLATTFRAVCVLKGAGSIIATPDGRYWINTTGNPGMASGGMGDALSGMIATFLAQGLDALSAAQLAVYLHGAAADACIEHGMAPHGLTASEVIFEARSLLNAGLLEHAHEG